METMAMVLAAIITATVLNNKAFFIFFIFFYFRERAVPRDRDSFFLDFLLDRGSKQCYYNKVYY